jgi:hypothetical protein
MLKDKIFEQKDGYTILIETLNNIRKATKHYQSGVIDLNPSEEVVMHLQAAIGLPIKVVLTKITSSFNVHFEYRCEEESSIGESTFFVANLSVTLLEQLNELLKKIIAEEHKEAFE